MHGAGRISAGIQTALYVAASPLRGIADGIGSLTTTVGIPGAGAGYLAGKLVSKVVAAGCNRLNKNRAMKNQIDTQKHVRRTIKILQTAGAIIGTPLVVMQALSHPVLTAFYAAPSLGTAAGKTIKNLMACKTVYQELRKYGTSETMKENLLDPVENLYLNIHHGDDLFHNYSERFSKTGNLQDLFRMPHLEEQAARHEQKREQLEQQYLVQQEKLQSQEALSLEDSSKRSEAMLTESFTPDFTTTEPHMLET
ncbi:hypothetical protein [Endozoicomonas numazuensis]|uniref:Uncharacterized protein n=1 Tax=Endozoicomonas numazuensis TaxID=1137799 RepID=A0A081NJD0_9GAMM|nr:hypothetical protein [Endozoicomonas numazuensis]KEQ18553.1 hypothetical protein GZ78_13915 [Endozoicomonas numazuensis]